ncbi:hypothetical protein Lal_00012170 [Lupinus albus]|nr:hypothetical protein Lal_00012170 [Lupinus albus]
MREVVFVAIAATLGNLLAGWDGSTIAGFISLSRFGNFQNLDVMVNFGQMRLMGLSCGSHAISTRNGNGEYRGWVCAYPTPNSKFKTRTRIKRG